MGKPAQRNQWPARFPLFIRASCLVLVGLAETGEGFKTRANHVKVALHGRPADDRTRAEGAKIEVAHARADDHDPYWCS
jgi:hypothetical protein